MTGDSGTGANFGAFKGHTVGIGPVVTYILPLGKQTFVTEFRWLPELMSNAGWRAITSG